MYQLLYILNLQYIYIYDDWVVFLACILSGSEGNLIEILLAFGLPSEFAEDPTVDEEMDFPDMIFGIFL